MLPLTEATAASMHPTGLPENVYIADASLFPGSLGNPPILTIMALAKKIGKMIIAKHA
jgi:choline dehydrogenase-like flavoprotein